jgi:polar amino acid transport system substrate-binding protein
MGRVDGTFLWFASEERAIEFHISDPVVNIEYLFFFLKTSNFSWQTMEDLRGLQIGATDGYDYGEDFASAEQQEILRYSGLPGKEAT